MGPDHCCGRPGTFVRHHFRYRWMYILLLSAVREMRGWLTTRLQCQHGYHMYRVVHPPSLLCWIAFVSILLIFNLAVNVPVLLFCVISVLVWVPCLHLSLTRS